MSTRPSKVVSAISTLWMPVVALAYLPDIVGQIMLVVGLDAWLPASHSVPLAPFAAIAVAVVLDRLKACTFRRALVVALVCILSHEVLDLLQHSDSRPWWPISDRPADIAVILTSEILVFGTLFGVFLVCRRVWRAPRSAWATRPGGPSGVSPLGIWLGRGLTALILLAAATTHYLRDVRERQLEGARSRMAEGDYNEALAILDQAERWPSTARPGRIDYARAEAFENLGDRDRAEWYYIRACEAAPTFFWALADLAVFYASSDEPVEVRRERVDPCLGRLQRDFADHEALPRFLRRLERKLGVAAGTGP